ncbi:hypothetical protein niasHT_027851 [Heterodera trifolii]|uniref:Lon proteolytic domain-containing protein n=1 Tax=Heterodera trifolii TaxID=157864 RepID=A0ABD2JKG1_9BILA
MSSNSVPQSLMSSRTLAIAAGTLSLSSGFVYLLYRCWNRSGRERERKAVSIVQTAMNGPYSFICVESDYIVNRMQKREFGFCVALKTTNSSNESGGLLLVTAVGGNLDEACSTSVILGRMAAVKFLGRRFPDKKEELAALLHLYVESLKPSNKGGSSVKEGVAVTGATASNGDVKPVNGIGQKVTAAVKSPVTRIILRKLNEEDFQALQIELSSKIEVIYVSKLDEAYAKVFDNDDTTL